MGILDDVANEHSQQTQPTQQPSTPAPAPASGGSLLDQVSAEQPQTAQSSNTPQAEGTIDRWKREAQEMIGKIVPQSAIPALEYGQEHLSQPLENVENSIIKGGERAGHMPAEALTFFQNPKAFMATPYGPRPSSESVEDAADRLNHVLAGSGEAIGGFGAQFVTPTNLALMAAMPEVKAESLLSKALAMGFAGQMSSGVKDQITDLSKNWDTMTPKDRTKVLTQLPLQFLATTLALTHAKREVFGESKPKVTTIPTPVNPKDKTGTVTGEDTTLRPTTRTTAGVEAPISVKQKATLAGGKPSLLAQAASMLTTPNEDIKFGKEQTAPAATQQALSTVGQVSEDKIAQHNAIVNGDPLPEGKAGTQVASKFTNPDQMWQAMQKTAQDTTFKKADDISQRETQQWDSKRKEAIQDYKDLIDRHNANIDAYNAQLPKDEPKMDHAIFDPTKVNIPERPSTYNELRSAVQRAEQDAKSSDAAVREQAHETDLPKAQKAMDQWFKQHSDEIDPAEYDSVKSLWRDSERFKEISMQLRGPLTQGNLSGRAMRQVEVTMNNRQIRRGQSPDAFQKLLGPDGYSNWQNVAKLFDTVKDPSLPEQFASWGKYAAEYAVSAIAPFLFHAVGPAVKFTMERLLNHVMFDPEFGQTFGKLVDWLKSKPGEIVSSISDMPSNLRDQFVSLAKNLWKSERGEAGAPGSVPLSPEEDQVSAHHANGGSTFSADGRDLGNVDKYSVGSYPDRTEKLDSLTPEQLKAFKDKNMDVLSQPDHVVGTWKDSDTGKHTLDIAKLYGDRDEAIAAGKSANQKSIYHLGRGELIDTGGTGEVLNSVSDVINRYNKSVGKPEVSDSKAEIDPRANDIADAYDKLKHNPNDPKVKKSYEALIHETKEQWHALEKAGYSLEVESKDPYGSDSSKPAYQEMAEDVKDNKRIKVWDGGKPPADHPLSGIDPETGVSYNTLFRAVHDIMGHVAGDNDFSQKGEENAYQRHAQSYSKEALPALTTETKGQTSHFFNNAKVRAGATPDFVDQRAALLPSEFHGDQPSEVSPNGSGESAASQEAINRLDSEKTQGVKRVVVDTRSGIERPLIGVDAVDYQPKPYESVEFRGGNRDGEVIDRGQGARPYQRKNASVEAARTAGTEAAKAAMDKSFPNPFAKPDLESKEITTRRPVAVKGNRDNIRGQNADLAAIQAAGEMKPDYKKKLARTVSEYSGVKYTPEDLKNPDKVLSKFINHAAGNIEWLYNQIPDDMKAQTKQWYDSAHEVTKQFAKDYGVSHEQAAGVVAALSPQNPWDNNIGLAKRMMDIYKNRQNFDFTPKMEGKMAELKGVATQSKAFKSMLDEIWGDKLSDVKDDDPNVQAVKRAMWIRLYDEAHGSPVNDSYAPDGTVSGHSSDARSWIGLDHAAKAVKILDDGSVNNINAVMGQGHKIRNFYNNLINPNSKNGHITIDTHATAAALLQPLGAKDTETSHTFGGSTSGIPKPPKNAALGIAGTYPLYAEAYQRVARKLGILPRELQSITWEGIKALMGDEKKTPEFKAKTKDIWNRVEEGKLTLNKARDMIKNEAGGFSKPAWMSDEEWERSAPDAGGDTSFAMGAH